MNNNIFIFTLGCIILFCVIVASHKRYLEHFGLIDDINRGINNVARVGGQLVKVATKIPTEANRFAKSAVDPTNNALVTLVGPLLCSSLTSFSFF